LAGRRTVLSDMSDWNPAELIGSHPSPLACSLFQFLVTDTAWREGRAQLGYFDPAGTSLLVVLAGRPYIDIRNSFNSLLPAALPRKIRELIIDEAINYVELNPYLHDKVEFDVLTTCYTPAFDLREIRFRRAGLTSCEIADFKSILRDHTEAMIRGDLRSLPSLMADLAEMDAARTRVLNSTGDVLSRVRYLLDDCQRRGTTPFASVARLAFVGNALLRSLTEIGAVSKQRAEAFSRSFRTVASEMTSALTATRNRALPLDEFLRQYGHLRPGTFDINSPRYDEDPGRYFANAGRKLQATVEGSPREVFRWTSAELAEISGALAASGFRLGPQEVLAFTQDAVVAREKAKFVFTKNLSDALKLLTDWGRDRGLSRQTLSYLRIDQLLGLIGKDDFQDHEVVERIAREAAALHARERQLILPELISSAKNLDHFRFNTNHPTFVTDGRVIAPIRPLSPDNGTSELNGTVILVESADPGYDWIFGHDIRGLITKYGGTASHMAIRCAEFGLPAAIGVGNMFETLRTAEVVELDCMNHVVRIAT
jgi:phosphohistidine swiveling domain-containing protein